MTNSNKTNNTRQTAGSGEVAGPVFTSILLASCQALNKDEEGMAQRIATEYGVDFNEI